MLGGADGGNEVGIEGGKLEGVDGGIDGILEGGKLNLIDGDIDGGTDTVKEGCVNTFALNVALTNLLILVEDLTLLVTLAAFVTPLNTSDNVSVM